MPGLRGGTNAAPGTVKKMGGGVLRARNSKTPVILAIGGRAAALSAVVTRSRSGNLQQGRLGEAGEYTEREEAAAAPIHPDEITADKDTGG